jgi:predicted nucleotidyltransferase
MEQRFELGNDETGRINQRLASAIGAEGRVLFAYLHGSFGKLPFSDIDIGAYSTIPD